MIVVYTFSPPRKVGGKSNIVITTMENEREREKERKGVRRDRERKTERDIEREAMCVCARERLTEEERNLQRYWQCALQK